MGIIHREVIFSVLRNGSDPEWMVTRFDTPGGLLKYTDPVLGLCMVTLPECRSHPRAGMSNWRLSSCCGTTSPIMSLLLGVMLVTFSLAVPH